jgi:hypothetical protein
MSLTSKRYFTSPLIYLSFTSACLMSLPWKWIRNIWTTHNTGSQAQLEMPTGWIIMHSDPVEFAHHSLTSCCKKNWTYKQGIFTCGWSLFQSTKENSYTVSIQCRHCVDTVQVLVQTLYEQLRLYKNSSPKETHKVHCCHFLRVRHTAVMGQTGELIRRSPLTTAFEQRLFAIRQHVST